MLSPRKAGVAAVVAAGLLALPAAASAASANTLYVGPPDAGASTKGCVAPGYTSVQSAVDAAKSQQTVYLCDTFAEQVVVNKSLKLTGDPGTGLQAPATFSSSTSRLPAAFANDNLFVPKSILTIWGSKVNVAVDGLTISGPIFTTTCADQLFGVLVISGANAKLTDDKVLDIRTSNPAMQGCQYGVGVQVGRRYWPKADFSDFVVENFVGTAQVQDTEVSGYQKNGMTIDGPGSSADVDDATVTGAGAGSASGIDAITAQNGIQISRGATGHVHDSTVSNNQYTGPSDFASAGGVLVFGGAGDPVSNNVHVDHNTLASNDVGIYLNNYNDDGSSFSATKNNNHADNNTITNPAVTNHSLFQDNDLNSYTGYQVGIDDVGNNDEINNNKIAGDGYAPRTTPGGPFTLPIDTISFPTKAKVHNNTYSPSI